MNEDAIEVWLAKARATDEAEADEAEARSAMTIADADHAWAAESEAWRRLTPDERREALRRLREIKEAGT